MTYEQAVALLQKAVGGPLRGVDSMTLQRLYIPLGIPIGLRSALGIAANAAERKGTSVEDELARKGLYTAPTTMGATQRGEYTTPTPAPTQLTGSQYAQNQAMGIIQQINPNALPQFAVTPRTPTPTPTPTPTQTGMGSSLTNVVSSILPSGTTDQTATTQRVTAPSAIAAQESGTIGAQSIQNTQSLIDMAASGNLAAQLTIASRNPGAPRAMNKTEWDNLQRRLPPEDRTTFEEYARNYLAQYGQNTPGYTPPSTTKINLPSQAVPLQVQQEPELQIREEDREALGEPMPTNPSIGVTPPKTEVAVPITPTTPKAIEYVIDPVTGRPLLDPMGRPIPVGPGGNLPDIQSYLARIAQANRGLQQAGVANTLAVRRATTEGELQKRKASREMYANRQLALNALAQRGIVGAPGLQEAAKRSAQSAPLARKLEAIRSMQDRIDTANILLAQEQQKKQEADLEALSDLTRAALISNQLKVG
jgi:hypothetical protein